MTWSYSGDPSSSNLDQVRFLIGDTDTTNQQLSNEEINFLLTAWNNVTYLAAAEGCMAIAGKYQNKADFSRTVGDLSITTMYQKSADGMHIRAEHLRNQAVRDVPPTPRFYVDADDNVFGAMQFSVGMDSFGS